MSASRRVTARFFDEVFHAYEQSPAVHALMRSALDERLPVEVEPYSFITSDTLRELEETLRPAPGETLVDLACGRGGPGMWVARSTGARLVGIDFSAVAVAQARARVAAFRLEDTARFHVGDLEATGLADARADALMCVDSIQFADDPGLVVAEVSRVLRPGGRLVFTSWEARVAGDSRVPAAIARLNLGHLLRAAGFAEVSVSERPQWHEREREVLRQALATDPGDDVALKQLCSEAGRVLQHLPHVRRVIATATRARA